MLLRSCNLNDIQSCASYSMIQLLISSLPWFHACKQRRWSEGDLELQAMRPPFDLSQPAILLPTLAQTFHVASRIHGKCTFTMHARVLGIFKAYILSDSCERSQYSRRRVSLCWPFCDSIAFWSMIVKTNTESLDPRLAKSLSLTSIASRWPLIPHLRQDSIEKVTVRELTNCCLKAQSNSIDWCNYWHRRGVKEIPSGVELMGTQE